MYICPRHIAFYRFSVYSNSNIGQDTFSQLVAAGIAGMFAFQTFVNMGVATGILPNTGMSLPFISYGGSSMWTNMVALGLMLNIRKRNKIAI